MIELFPNISEECRNRIKFGVEITLKNQSVALLKQLRDSCVTEEERNFCDFYFDLRMKEIRNDQTSAD